MEVNFNSNGYVWADVVTVLLRREVTGPRGVEYKARSQVEALFASGRKAWDTQRGKKEYKGTITLLQNRLIALDRAAQGKGYRDISDISFDVIVSYVPASGVVTTDKIIGISFTEIPCGMREGDLRMKVVLPFIALDVVFSAL